MSQGALGHQFGGVELYHPVTKDVVRAVQRGHLRHLGSLRGLSEILGQGSVIDQPYAPGDLSKGLGFVRSSIHPDARVALRQEGEEPGDEDITAMQAPWRAEGVHQYDIHNPRAVTPLRPGGMDIGQQFASARGAPLLKAYSNNEFYHHTSDPAARDIIHRLTHGEPGLLLSREGDSGGGVYTSADPTAWGKISGGHGFRFDLHLHGVRGLGAGPGGSTSMYDPDPPEIVRRRYMSGHARTQTDPNFWREHGYDTVVSGGKETVATHPLQVQVLRAHDKATGRVIEFQDSIHRHYKPEMRVQESDYSPRQEHN